jgi:hypothetical protein
VFDAVKNNQLDNNILIKKEMSILPFPKCENKEDESALWRNKRQIKKMLLFYISNKQIIC